MVWDEDALYRRFLERDASLDGTFVAGVLTTGIYCLASCPARRPKRENTRFFHTPDQAAAVGLRPCRRCRPDAFYRGEEWHRSLFEQTVARVAKDVAAFKSVADLVSASGLSRTALNALFRKHAGEPPGAFLRRERLRHAQALLRAGMKPADAAAAAGYRSSSSFHEHFASLAGTTPGAWRDAH